jgi:hypothetical protein
LFGKTNISLSGDEEFIEIDFKSIGFGPVGRRNDVAFIVTMILTTRVPLLRAFYAAR